MADLRTLFPNLTGADFKQADGSAVQFQNGVDGVDIAGEQFVYDWARVDNTQVIPLSKLPDLQLAHVFTYTDPSTAGTTTTPRTDLEALNAFRQAYDDATTGDLFVNLNAGDLVIITYTPDATAGPPPPTTVVEYLYTGADEVQAGGAIPGTGEDNFSKIVQSAATSVNSLFPNADDNIILSAAADGAALNGAQTGALHIRLDDTLADITSIAPAAGASLTLGSTATDEDTTVQGHELSLSSTLGMTIAAGGSLDIDADTTIDIGINDSQHIEFSSSRIELDGTLRFQHFGTTTAGTNLAVGDKVLIANGNGDVLQRDVASLGVGAYGTKTDLTDTPSQSLATNGDDWNKVIFIPAQSAQLTLTVPHNDGTNNAPNGTWLKFFNESGRTDTILAGAFPDGAGGQANLTLDDSTANFEVIWINNEWKLLTV